MPSFTPPDNLIGPIISQLAGIAGQIQGVGRVYTTPPEGEPEDNSVLLPLKRWRIIDSTNARTAGQYCARAVALGDGHDAYPSVRC